MIETIGFILTGLGLTASIVYYANILNNANKTRDLQLKAQEHATETRQAQLFVQISNQTLNNPAFMKGFYVILESDWKDFDDYLEFLGSPGSENFNNIFLVGGIMESISILVEEGLVDIHLVASLMARIVIAYYEKMEPFLRARAQWYNQTREQGKKSIVEWKVVNLYNAIIKYIEEHPNF